MRLSSVSDILISLGGDEIGYANDMERCLAHIDTHLSENITASELAAMLGYSFYHFCHVFKNIVGMSVGAYLRKKRLELAAGNLLDGESVTDAAMNCGYETPSGFTRAFVRRYGISPTEYKRKGGINEMEFEIKTFGAYTAVGYSLAPAEGDLDIIDNGAYWKDKDFSSVSPEDYARLCLPNNGEIGAWIQPDDESGEFRYFFGPITKDTSFIPDGMLPLSIPENEYAVFKVASAKSAQELADNVKTTWNYIFKDWFNGSAYRYKENAIAFEYYFGEDTFVYVPIV